MDKKRSYIAPDADNAVEIDAIIAVVAMTRPTPGPGPEPEPEPEPDI